MTTPSAFKIVSLSTPSAFQSNEKVNKIYNSLTCSRVYILPLVEETLTIYTLDLTGVCMVILPAGTPPGAAPAVVQCIIQSVTGLVPGQIVTFFNKNVNGYDYQINTGIGGIIYTGDGGPLRSIEVDISTPTPGLFTSAGVGWYNGTSSMYFIGGIPGVVPPVEE